MMGEREIKEFEKEQLNKLLIELKDINNFKRFEDGAFKYSLGKYQADLIINHIENLKQRIDKTIEMIGLIVRDIQENNVPPKIQDLYEILSILQDEEVEK